MRVQVCVWVSGVGGGTTGWCGVTAGQVEAVLPVQQHLLLVALHSEWKAEVKRGHGVNRFIKFSTFKSPQPYQKNDVHLILVLQYDLATVVRNTAE